jgi:serine/threonine protein kinase/Tfp pilus assembly protein PilF
MRPADDDKWTGTAAPEAASPGPTPPVEDSDLIRAVEEYAAALEAGVRPDRQEFLARHPTLAAELAECLDGLEFVAAAASDLGQPTAGVPTPPAEQAPPPFQFEGYQIVREIGRGGMGVVYEAVEVALGRRVALKLLPSAAALDARQLQRFKHEARAAALLHHGNIVPVFGVGCEHGVHYYAMQYIDGVNLAAVIDLLRQRAGLATGDPSVPGSAPVKPAAGTAAHTLPDAAAALSTQHGTDRPAYFRSVAQLGVQAAEALEHAHEVGVVHRDIKPANLLIDARARLWITDFGLALCQDEGRMTRTGDLVGTLRYVSPEQALGRPGLVDHRTDVYGLGVTLYELLTLEPAYPGNDRQELLRQIAFEEPRPARRLNPALPVELETILLKAMAKEPAGRYATARELAEDLRRFLEDRPIRARRPTFYDRASKWARRHKPLVGATAILLGMTLVGLAISTTLIWREQRNTLACQLKTNLALEEAQAKQRLAQEVVDDTYTQVANLLENEPLSEHLQREFFLKAMTCYRQFARENGSDSEIKRKAARAGQRLGDVLQRLGEYEQARQTYAEALDHFTQLVADHPDVAGYRQDLAACTNSLGVLLAATGQPREAAATFRRAISYFEEPAGAAPAVPDPRDGRATAYLNLAMLLLEIDGEPGWREAENCCQQALALREQIATEDPASAKNRHGQAQAHNGLGILYWEAGQLARAEQSWRRALALSQTLAQQSPRRTEYVHTLASCSGHLGTLLVLTDRLQEAEPYLRRSLELGQRLANDFPQKHEYRRKLAVDCNMLSVLLHRTGRLPEAEQVGRRAVELGTKLVDNHPDERAHRRELASSCLNLGNVLKDLGRLQEAEDRYGRALSLVEKCPNGTDESPQTKVTLGDCRNNLGSIFWMTGRLPEAEQSYLQAHALRGRLVKAFPSVPTYRDNLASSCNNLGRLYRSLGRLQEAEQFFRQALDLWTDSSPAHRSPGKRAEGHDRLGQLLWQRGRLPAAHAEFLQAAAERERLLKQLPDHADTANVLAWFLVTCPDPDVRNPDRAVELATKAVSRAPKVGAYWNTLGVAHYRAGDYRAALAALEKAVELTPQGDGTDSLFLAMTCWRLGQNEEAQGWYERAAGELELDHISAAELSACRTEAVALLGINDPPRR